MKKEMEEPLDPRVHRTRMLLHQALGKLLKKKPFDKISVGDITNAAALNRATFYDHYPDKTALLECVVAGRFLALLDAREVHFDGSCPSALKELILAVCEYLGGMRGPNGHIESAIISVVRRMILEGLQKHPANSSVTPEIRAATASWAIYGAAKEWALTPRRGAADKMASGVMLLLAPIIV